jgi:hypothetical protein
MRNAPVFSILSTLSAALLMSVQAHAASAETPEHWQAIAVDAREQGDLGQAATALQKAAELGLSPIAVGFEEARQRLTAGDRAAAVAVLQGLSDNGFTAVGAISNDPVLGGLAGYAPFDALVADMSTRAYPCAHDERFRAFDFWVGDWDVHLANGTFAGTNTISVAEQGCVLLEEWQSASGGTGRSINYLDADSGEWVQIWNDASGSQINIRGGLTAEGMLLNGQIHYVGNGTTAVFRGLWTPLPDGRVRQFFEQSADGGESWSPWFEGFYSRQATSD